jgi:protein TonB
LQAYNQGVRTREAERRQVETMSRNSRPASEQASVPRPPLEWSEKAARDRLSSTVFIAALFHGVVILGVSFTGGEPPRLPVATSLDVVLVTSDDAAVQPDEDAQLLAQQSVSGAGNTREANQLQTALTQSAEAPAGPDRAGSDQSRIAGRPDASRPVLVAAAESGAPQPREVGEPEPANQQRQAMPGDTSYIEIVDEPADSTLISDAGPRELVISASTRESRIAAYLSGWKRQVERVGTLNFPRQAQSRAAGRHPTLEVAIASNGVLKEVVVRNSSGERIVDDAAIEILRIAAPFDPFPEFLRSEYDVLRFAYEWRFGPEPGVARMSARGGS